MFSSETDAETVSHLIERHYDGDLVEAVARAFAEMEGHFTFVAIHADHPDLLVAARLQTPLVVGIGDGENFLASNAAAFLSETARVYFPDDGDIVAITPDSSRSAGRRRAVEHELIELDWDLEGAEKGGFETFMLKEIHEQPEAVAETIGDRVRHGRLCLEGLGMADDELARAPPHRHPRDRHRLPRRRRGPLRDRGVGARPRRARHRLRVGLPQPGARQGHARDRDLSVGRDARHDRGDEARRARWARTRRDHEHDGLADHARGRLGALHARRPRGERAASKTFTAQLSLLFLVALKLAQVRETMPPEELEFIAQRRLQAARRRSRSSSTAAIRSRRSRGGISTSRSSSISAATSACPSRSRARSS